MPTDPNQLIQSAAASANAFTLNKMLAGPGADTALAALGQVFLGDAQASAADIAAEIQKGGADVSLKIQQAEQQCLSQLGPDADLSGFFPAPGDITQNDLDNTKDARQMQIQLHDKTNERLAYWVTGGFFFMIAVLFFFPQVASAGNGDVRNLLFTLLGVVATQWANIIGFYFGSSAGSQQKTQTLAATLDQAMKNNN